MIELRVTLSGRIEPFFSVIRPAGRTTVVEYAVLATAVLLLPIGAFVALRPLWQRGPGTRYRYLVNGLVAAVLLAVCMMFVIGMTEDIYPLRSPSDSEL